MVTFSKLNESLGKRSFRLGIGFGNTAITIGSSGSISSLSVASDGDLMEAVALVETGHSFLDLSTISFVPEMEHYDRQSPSMFSLIRSIHCEGLSPLSTPQNRHPIMADFRPFPQK